VASAAHSGVCAGAGPPVCRFCAGRARLSPPIVATPSLAISIPPPPWLPQRQWPLEGRPLDAERVAFEAAKRLHPKD
jgi:hypothetical protein